MNHKLKLKGKIMNKLIKMSALALAISIPSLASASVFTDENELDFYAYAGLSNSSMDLDNISIGELSKNIGVGVVLKDISLQVGYRSLNSDYNEFNVSAMYDFYSQNDISVYGKLDLGSGRLSLDEYENSNTIKRLSAGLGVKYKYNENISFLAEVLTHNFIDKTTKGNTYETMLCNDGTVGSGICAFHGGVATITAVTEEVDLVGNGSGTEVGISVRYNF